MKSSSRKLSLVAGALAALAASSASAFADDDRYCGHVPRAEWKSISEVSEAIEAKGYQIREIDTDDGCYEVDVRDQSGKKFELYVHPRTLEIVKTERD